jgi:hypothetical protein
MQHRSPCCLGRRQVSGQLAKLWPAHPGQPGIGQHIQGLSSCRALAWPGLAGTGPSGTARGSSVLPPQARKADCWLRNALCAARKGYNKGVAPDPGSCTRAIFECGGRTGIFFARTRHGAGTIPLIPELATQPPKGATRHAHSSRYYPHRPRGDLDVRAEGRTHRQPRSACRRRHPDARRHRRDVAAHADTQQVTPFPDDYPQPP